MVGLEMGVLGVLAALAIASRRGLGKGGHTGGHACLFTGYRRSGSLGVKFKDGGGLRLGLGCCLHRAPRTGRRGGLLDSLGKVGDGILIRIRVGVSDFPHSAIVAASTARCACCSSFV
jgi:hypothetical protein